MKEYPCFILKEKNLVAWVSELMRQEKVLAPISVGDGKFSFEYLTNAKDIRLDYTTTMIPPTQKALLPQNEVVLSWAKVDGRTVFTAGSAPAPTIIFGIHPYDIHALKALDYTMGKENGNLADPDYVAKRAVTTIIGLDMLAPPPNSFCDSIGTHTVEDGFDLLLTNLGDGRYFVEVGSRRGYNLILHVTSLRADREDLALRDKIQCEVALKYQREMPIDLELLADFLEEKRNHPFFEATGELCVACAKCTIVCPTCTCCNIKEEPALDGKTGCRVRECDSCQLSGFTKMAGGVIARKTPGERVRHRLFDKFAYNHGTLASCVGCGRCVDACPAGIADPVRAIEILVDEEITHE